MLTSSHASAIERFCVGNDAELATALVQASQLAQIVGMDSEIRIRQRVQAYAIDNPPYAVYDAVSYRGLSLLGGYSADLDDACTDGNRLINPVNTRITFTTNNDLTFSASEDLKVEGLTVNNNHLIKFVSGGTALVLEKNIFRQALYILDNPAWGNDLNVVLSNNQVTVVGSIAGCTVEIDSFAYKSQTVVATNNTIANNNGSGAVCLSGDSNLTASFYNNIIYGNAGCGICDLQFNTPTPVTTYNNILQSNNQIVSHPLDVGTLTSSDPQFVQFAGANDFHLKPTSPAVNSGTLLGPPLPYYDIEGNLRQVGSTVDRGAYESPNDNVSQYVIVNSTSDANNLPQGQLSLRQAILNANSNPDETVIRFALPCPSTIVLSSPLPDITASLDINGYLLSNGAYPNDALVGFNAKICVNVASTTNMTSAFHVPSPGAGVELAVLGMKLAGFQKAIFLEGGSNHRISGNDFTSDLLPINDVDVAIGGKATGVHIGDTDPSARNLLGGANDYAIDLGSDFNFVVGNLIGPGRSGSHDSNTVNGTGIRIHGSNNLVDSNIVSGNTGVGILLSGTSQYNTIRKNVIGVIDGGCGTDAGCSPALGNGIAGIEVDPQVGNNYLVYNTIGYNPVGVCVYGKSTMINANSIHDNTSLGIDLVNPVFGATCNGIVNDNNVDASEPTDSANKGQNYPVLFAVDAAWKKVGGVPTPDSTNGYVKGQLASHNGTFYINLYASGSCNASGHGEGEEPVGNGTVSISGASAGANGSVTFVIPIRSSTPALTDRYITALARDTAGNTSEFSQCSQFVSDRIFFDSLEGKPASP